MTLFADYDYYKSVYGGSAVSEEEFPRLAAKASAYIDRITFGRASGHADDERVKWCCCELCDTLSEVESDGLRKQSESIGSWSVTYANSENTSELSFARAACRVWLPADWLYRGVDRE